MTRLHHPAAPAAASSSCCPAPRSGLKRGVATLEVYIPPLEMDAEPDPTVPVYARVAPGLLQAAKSTMRHNGRTMREVIEWALRVYLAKYDPDAADALGISVTPR